MRRGFTLIELMLVVIIIGILVGMVVPRLTGRSQEARIAAAKADIQANLALALDLYELDNGYYPKTGLDELCQKKDKKGPYIKKCPPLDPWGNPYQYKSLDDGKDYELISFGPDGQAGGGDDITSKAEAKSE